MKQTVLLLLSFLTMGAVSAFAEDEAPTVYVDFIVEGIIDSQNEAVYINRVSDDETEVNPSWGGSYVTPGHELYISAELKEGKTYKAYTYVYNEEYDRIETPMVANAEGRYVFTPDDDIRILVKVDCPFSGTALQMTFWDAILAADGTVSQNGLTLSNVGQVSEDYVSEKGEDETLPCAFPTEGNKLELTVDNGKKIACVVFDTYRDFHEYLCEGNEDFYYNYQQQTIWQGAESVQKLVIAGGARMYSLTVYLDDATTTAVQALSSDNKPVKIIKDGKIVIRHGGMLLNLMGQIVK